MIAAGSLGWILLSLINGHLARTTRIGFWGTFFLSLLLSPIVVLFVIILLSYIGQPRENY